MDDGIPLNSDQALMIMELERRIGRSIPHLATIESHTIGIETRKGHIIQLRLYKCGLNTLPETLDCLNSLQKLYLNSHEFKTFPEQILRLKSLRTLDVSGNQLTTLPESFGDLDSLQELN